MGEQKVKRPKTVSNKAVNSKAVNNKMENNEAENTGKRKSGASDTWPGEGHRHTVRISGSRRRTAAILTAGTIVCIAATLFFLYDYHKTGMESERAMESLRGLVGEPVATEALHETAALDGTTQEDAVTADSLREGEHQRENPYTEIFQQYADIKGWLRVEGTAIDYPILQREGDDEYYLYLDFRGEEDKRGSLILDEDSSVENGSFTTNLLVHGHNMKDGSMFGELDKYRSEDYYKEHTRMTLYTRDGVHDYEVAAVFDSQVYYATDLVFKYYNFFQADTVEEFRYFYDNIKELSLYDTGVTAEFGDKFLTLSTCAYHVEDGRFVVVAKEIKPK